MMPSMLQLSDSVAFWGSGEGITIRLEMLGGALETGSYNIALQVAAPVYGAKTHITFSIS
jgi:hypothetical protein